MDLSGTIRDKELSGSEQVNSWGPPSGSLRVRASQSVRHLVSRNSLQHSNHDSVRTRIQSKERHLRDTHTTRAAPAGIDLLAGSHVLCIVLLLRQQPCWWRYEDSVFPTASRSFRFWEHVFCLPSLRNSIKNMLHITMGWGLLLTIFT